MACRFPGSPDLATYWANILGAVDSTSEIPPDRWDPAIFFDPDSDANDRVACRRGGYLAAPIPFDPASHGIMPVAVEGGEPEQFLILDAARMALADAGMASGVPDGRRVEVVVGRGNYFNRGNLTRLQHGRIAAQTLAILDSLHPEWTEADREAVRLDLKASLPPFEAAIVPGQLTNATAGRVANRLDFSGASYVVDAASASSLVALDLAARSLEQGRSDLALVGGVYLEADVDFPLVFQPARGPLPLRPVPALRRRGRRDALGRGGRASWSSSEEGMPSATATGSMPCSRGSGSPPTAGGSASPRRAPGATPGRSAGPIAGPWSTRATVGLVEGHGLGLPAADRAELRALRATFPPIGPGRRVLGAVSAR